MSKKKISKELLKKLREDKKKLVDNKTTVKKSGYGKIL